VIYTPDYQDYQVLYFSLTTIESTTKDENIPNPPSIFEYAGQISLNGSSPLK
jgi:hypothetical protein